MKGPGKSGRLPEKGRFVDEHPIAVDIEVIAVWKDLQEGFVPEFQVFSPI